MSQKKLEPILITSLFAVAAIGGYLLTKSADTTEVTTSVPVVTKPMPKQQQVKTKPLTRKTNLRKTSPFTAELPEGALANERLILFDNDTDYQTFIAELKDRGLTLLGSSNSLRAARVRLGQHANLEGLEENQLAYNYLVTPPTPPDANAQEGALGFGPNALLWLGLTGDNSSWGQGVTVAVIDSGVTDHTSLNNGNGSLSIIELTELANGAEQLDHGTAVASIIAGNSPITPGVAPAADILSIRVTDENGSSDSFTLAEGIIQAVQAGAEVINISMGSAANSIIVAEAVEFALAQGSVIIASSGNEGSDQASFPAGNEGVISVGAVEAQGEHLDFSNSDSNLDIVAPGFQVNAAWGSDLLIPFSGTSASAPYVSGAIAATMSEFPELSAAEAANVVLSYSNDSGLPGNDADFGGGILALDRIMERNTAGIYDAAIAGQVITGSGASTTALITIQNQGTEPLINSPVVITSPNGTQSNNISSLLPGQIHTFSVPVSVPTDGSTATISSSVATTENDKDTRNNQRSIEIDTSNP